MDLNQSVSAVQQIIEYNFTDSTFLKDALCAPGSFFPITSRHGREANERLAVIGDIALKLTLAEPCCLKCSNGPVPGTYDILRQSVESNKNLTAVGLRAGLDTHVSRSQSQVNIGCKAMATAIEAIFGAVYLDSHSTEAVRAVMRTLNMIT
ncbi:MAG: hypothetical protein L6R40_005992 [Gallowayella cf. fulva]|nr:MAG: hypothetical protein L6R40_005992 [Xanthomendoza cf. fulva]